jgi:hypothetical protein
MLLLGSLALAACGGQSAGLDPVSTGSEPGPTRVPRIGTGPRYRPKPAGRLAVAARPVGGLRCIRDAKRRFGVHLEVFARAIDVVIPAGIGVAPPRRRDGAYVRGGRCSYPARTLEPTGLIEVQEGQSLTLGEFFDVWGQPLSRKQVLTFAAREDRELSAFVDGRPWRGDPRSIPLTRHAAIVVEVGGYFPPTRRYRFPAGL